MDTKTEPVFNEKLANASASVIKTLFHEANGDISTILNRLLSEKGENKDTAFSLLIGFSQTGLMPKEELVLALSRISPTENEKLSALISAYMRSDPDDSSCIALMDAIKDRSPELIADIILAKKNWDMKDIRRHLMKYLFSEKLWLKLATIEEELRGRK